MLGDDNETLRINCFKLIKKVIAFKVKYQIGQIRIGYEPAYDDDTCLVEIGNTEVDVERVVKKLVGDQYQ